MSKISKNNLVEITDLEKENSKVAYKIAKEGIVLLKNNNCLPLKNKNIALFGSGVRYTSKVRTVSEKVNN